MDDEDKASVVMLAFSTVIIILVVIIMMSSGCTVNRQKVKPDGRAHISTMPAVQICILAACDGQWADRAQRAGADAEETGGDTTADQEASSTPTLHIPVAGAAPLKIPLPTTNTEVLEKMGPVLEKGRLPAMENFEEGDENKSE